MPTQTTNYRYWDTDVRVTVAPFGQQNTIEITRTIQRINAAGTATMIDPGHHSDEMETEGAVPSIGQLYPDPTSLTSWAALARSRGYSLTSLDNGMVQASVRYSTLWTTDPSSETLDVVLPSRTDYAAVTRSLAIFRTGWSVQPSNTNETANIGGTSITGGEGHYVVQVPQVRIRVSFTQDASYSPRIGAATSLSGYINTLNTLSFMGCAPGTLLCEGVNVGDAGDEFYDVVFDFLFDAYFHLEQVATLDADGKPKLTSGGAALAEVKWKRVARTAVDFNLIYSSDEALKIRTQNGWWGQPPP